MDAATTRLTDLAQLACRAATSDIAYDVDSFFDALTYVSEDELPRLFRLAAALDPSATLELDALHQLVLKVSEEAREVPHSAVAAVRRVLEGVYVEPGGPVPIALERARNIVEGLRAPSSEAMAGLRHSILRHELAKSLTRAQLDTLAVRCIAAYVSAGWKKPPSQLEQRVAMLAYGVDPKGWRVVEASVLEGAA